MQEFLQLCLLVYKHLVFFWSAYITYVVGCTDAELKPHSLRLNQIWWSFPGRLYFCSFYFCSNGTGRSSGHKFHGGLGTLPLQCRFTHLLCLGSLSPLFYYFLSAWVIIPDFPPFVVKLTQRTFNDICCDHIHWTCWLFVAVSSRFMPWLIPSAEWLPISWLICCHIS